MSYVKKNWQNTPSTATALSAENLNHMDQGIYDAHQGLNELQGLAYGPLKAATAADMTDQTRVYVYTGSETGYVAGNWYYYDGAAWVSGGVYNAVAVSTDKTLSISDKAADARETGKVRNEFEQLSFKGVMNLQGDWVRGYSNVSTGVIENINYRVTHANWLKFSQDVTIFLASDSYSYNAFDSNFNLLTGTTINPLTITAGTAFRVNIRKRPETPSSPADVAELSSKLLVRTVVDTINDRIDDCVDNLNICLDAHDALATNTDLDNVTGIGFYPMGYSSIYTHDPIGTNHRRLLIVFKNASLALVCQIIVDEDSGNIYSRAYADGAWLDWKSKFDTIQTTVTNNKSVTYSAKDTLVNGTDFNDVTAIGFYPIAYASTHGNDPIGKNHRRLLIVLKKENVAINGQIIIDEDSGNIYIRAYSDGAWRDWKSKFDNILDVIDTEKLRPKNLDTHSHTIAHRGVPYSTPAATKPSYVKAKKMGLLIAEGDIRFTSDNVPILFHDATYTVNGVTHTIANETYEQFMEYDIGAAFSPAFAGTYGLTLSEFLDLCNDLQLYPTIEFKVGTTQQVNDCLAIIDSKRVKVFNYKASVANLKTIIDHDPYASVRLGADDYSDTLKNNLIALLAYGEQKHQVHCIFAYGYGSWTSEQIAACRATGAIMGVSSINNNTQLQALTEDVDIIFTEHGFNATMYKTINAMAD